MLSPTGTKKGYVPARQQPGEVFMPALYDGPMPTTWQENPRFTAAAAGGANWGQAEGHYGNHEGPLESLDNRVPIVQDRLVHDVPDAIGEYGGFSRMANSGWPIDMRTLSLAGVVKWGNDGVTMTPYVLKDIGMSDDGRVMTGVLRQGMKWSDGTPLNIENIRFAHEDLMNNPEYRPNPVYPCKDLITGNRCNFEIVDDKTYTYTFDTPNFIVLEGEGAAASHYQCRGTCIYASAFLKQFHPGYADPSVLAAQIAEQDLDNWVSHFMTRVSVHGPFYRLQPVVGPWVQTEGLSVGAKLSSEANPFYHVFDPEGNQLPYLDGTESVGFESREVAVFRAMAGESDGHTQIYQTDEIPLYQLNMVKGDYSLYPWPDLAGGDSYLGFNQTYNDDPEIGRMIRQKDFRIALSLATDREKLNEVVFLGLGVPSNKVPHFSTPFYPGDEYRTVDAVRDLARANSLLDGLGYRDTDGDGIRNRKGDLTGDTGNIELALEISSDRWPTLVQILVEDWADVGIKLDWKQDESWYNHIRDDEGYFGIGGGHGNPNPFGGFGIDLLQGASIDKWRQTDGAEGMGQTGPDENYLPLAPVGTWPADSTGNMKVMFDTIMSGKSFEMLHPTRVAAGKSYNVLVATEKFYNSYVNFAPSFRGIMLKRNNFRNVPKHQNWDAIGFSMYETYFEGGMDNMHNPGNRTKLYPSESFLTGLSY